jgi:hypothetical protein
MQPDGHMRLDVVTGEIDIADDRSSAAHEVEPQVRHPRHLRQVQQRPQNGGPQPRAANSDHT